MPQVSTQMAGAHVDIENEKSGRNGKHAIAKSLEAGRGHYR